MSEITLDLSVDNEKVYKFQRRPTRHFNSNYKVHLEDNNFSSIDYKYEV